MEGAQWCWLIAGGSHQDGKLRLEPVQRTLELVCDADGLVFLRGSAMQAELRSKWMQVLLRLTLAEADRTGGRLQKAHQA